MKRVLGLTLMVAAGAFVVFTSGCVPPPAVPSPENLMAEASDDGASVILSWDPVTVEGEEVTYEVYFEGSFVEEEITATEYEHFEPGKAGDYEVYAVAGGEASDPADLSTEPVTIKETTVSELNGAGKSGIAFDPIGGTVDIYSMDVGADDRNKVDCYFTNWASLADGFGGQYSLASPDEVSSNDPGDPDPGFTNWRTSGISDALDKGIEDVSTVPGTEEQTGEKNYFNFTDVTVDLAYAVSNQDNYFGVVQVDNIDDTNGDVSVRVTFQPIKGLRLF